MRVLIVGSGAREHAIAKALTRSATKPSLFCCGTHHNPGINALTEAYWQGNIECIDSIVKQASDWQINLAIIGPEVPLAKGIVDALENQGIACVGPKKIMAQLETSKTFTRQLMERHQIAGRLQFRAFTELAGVRDYLELLGENGYVIKADGLMGGKGVKVAGEHLLSFQDAYAFCQDLLLHGQSFVIEEKLIGQEFSLLNFCDGKHLVPMPLVQDHKRAFENDQGPNTGGMGSISDANHRLPFITNEDFAAAQAINNAVLNAVTQECQQEFKGILYGSFMATQQGVKLIEYNARFGDPEVINVLALLESDFLEICQNIVNGTLNSAHVRFKNWATVCKYAVPTGYPEISKTHIHVDLSHVTDLDCVYFGAVESFDDELFATGSRALAVLGVRETIEEAEKIAEDEINRIRGALFHRTDIGTRALTEQRVQMMQALRHP